jgi:hypothetical protein
MALQNLLGGGESTKSVKERPLGLSSFMRDVGLHMDHGDLREELTQKPRSGFVGTLSLGGAHGLVWLRAFIGVL